MLQNKLVRLQALVTLILFLASLACGQGISPTLVGQVTTEPSGEEQAAATTEPEATETLIEEPTLVPTELGEIPIRVVFDLDHTTEGLILDTGGDVDTEVVSLGSPPELALRTGNGEALSSSDGNTAEDYYMQFSIDDAFIFRSLPTSRVQIEIEYLDEGIDTFSIQYDAISGGPEGDGRFKDTGVVVKSDSGEFKTAVFPLCDAYFANRTNGGDFRISDGGDGAETIRRVSVALAAPTAGSVTIYVDSCGANPFDDQPDSDAIQDCIDRACSGDTVLFTSGVNSPGYQGYVIDKTVFLVRTLCPFRC
jgi:hypothetical protein